MILLVSTETNNGDGNEKYENFGITMPKFLSFNQLYSLRYTNKVSFNLFDTLLYYRIKCYRVLYKIME